EVERGTVAVTLRFTDCTDSLIKCPLGIGNLRDDLLPAGDDWLDCLAFGCDPGIECCNQFQCRGTFGFKTEKSLLQLVDICLTPGFKVSGFLGLAAGALKRGPE